MEAFQQHTGVALPLQRDNIDTDAIIPSREMRSVSKSGLAAGLFAPWRYLQADEFEMPVQVLGKLRAKVMVPQEASKDEMEAAARAAVADRLEGKEVVKTIVVPGRLVNFVVK